MRVGKVTRSGRGRAGVLAGSLPDGPAATTPTAGTAPTGGALRGAPVARRLGRPRWWDPRIIAGVIVVILAVVVGAKVIGSNARTTAVFTAAHDLSPGTALVSGDLVPVDVRLGDSLRLYLAADAAATTVGRRVTVPLAAGQLVPASALAEPATGRVIVIGVAADAMPPGVAHGSTIDLYLTTGGSASSGSAGTSKTDQVAAGITVQSVTAPASGGLSGAGSNRFQVAVLLDAPTADRLVRLLPAGAPIVVLRSGG